jgi:hypothetical protein
MEDPAMKTFPFKDLILDDRRVLIATLRQFILGLYPASPGSQLLLTASVVTSHP